MISRWLKILFALASAAVALSQSEPTYSNPIIAGDFPDPSLLRVGNEYWAVGTSGEWSPQFPIYKSSDLVNWKPAGAVFDFRPKWASSSFWAPQMVFHNGLYYIYYTARKQGGSLSVAVAAAFKPEGPYRDYGPLVSQPAGSIDPTMVKDEGGDPYLIWKEDGNSRNQPTVIWAQRLEDNGIQLTGEPKQLLRNDEAWESAVIEGPFVLQRGDYFYMFYAGNGCCGTGCNYAVGVARAKALLGPWEKNPANPILAGNSQWKCPGHGSVVRDENGRYWLMYHAYNVASIPAGRQALLDEVMFNENGWPEINAGHGPASKGLSPLGKIQRNEDLKYSDTFTAGSLKPGWTWPVSDEPPGSVSLGQLIVSSPAAQGTNLMGGVIARKAISSEFTATTILLRSKLESGVIAGLAAVHDRGNSTGIALLDQQVILWTRTRNQQQVHAQTPAPRGRQIWFQISGDGKQLKFSFSADGKSWQEFGVQAMSDRLLRVGLTSGGVRNAEARFDSFEMAPK